MIQNINNLNEQGLNRKVDERALAVVKKFMANYGFPLRKIADTPTDNLSVVPRKYVTMNGTVANRPSSSVAVVGQPYFATDTSIPMTYTRIVTGKP